MKVTQPANPLQFPMTKPVSARPITTLERAAYNSATQQRTDTVLRAKSNDIPSTQRPSKCKPQYDKGRLVDVYV